MSAVSCPPCHTDKESEHAPSSHPVTCTTYYTLGDTRDSGYNPWILRLTNIWNAKSAPCLCSASINQTSEDKWLLRQSRDPFNDRYPSNLKKHKKTQKNRELCATEKEAEKQNRWALNKNENLITLPRLWMEHFIPFFVFCSVRQA